MQKIMLGIILLGIFTYNIPLGIIACGYFIVRHLVITHQRLFDSCALILIIIATWLKFAATTLMTAPTLLWRDFHTNSFYTLLQHLSLKKQIVFLYYKMDPGLRRDDMSAALKGPSWIHTTLSHQIHHLSYIYQHGLFYILILPLILQLFFDWSCIAESVIPDSIRDPYLEIPKHQNNRQETPPTTATTSVPLGYDNKGQHVSITDHELNQHCLIIGTTGSGKTTTLLNFVTSCAQRGLPLVFLDGKGSVDLIDNMAHIANHYGRTFRVFTLRPRPEIPNLAGYNPLGSGTATEWKNRIMSLFAQVEGKGQEHFSLGEQNYINFVANVLAKLAPPVDLRVILSFLENPDKLLALAHELEPEIGKKLATLHADNELRQLIGDVIKLLELFIYSDYGHLFNTTKLSNVITLTNSILNNEIVLFQFDASAYPEDTRKVAKMVINDLNSSFASFGKFTKCFCIFDEFASYASDNLAETISLHRSNGMHAIIGSQSLTTVKLKASDTKRIAEELIACCNTYIAQTINHFADSEIMAKIMGVAKNYETSTTLSYSQTGINSSQHTKLTDSYKVHPQNILDLHQGEAIVYRKAANLEPIKIKITSVIPAHT